MFHALGCFTVKVYSFEEMPKYIVHLFFYFFCFCTDMVGEEDQQQGIRKGRIRKGKIAMTNSHQKER